MGGKKMMTTSMMMMMMIMTQRNNNSKVEEEDNDGCGNDEEAVAAAGEENVPFYTHRRGGTLMGCGVARRCDVGWHVDGSACGETITSPSLSLNIMCHATIDVTQLI